MTPEQEENVRRQENVLCGLWDTLVDAFRREFPESTMALFLDHWGASTQWEDGE